MAEIWEKMKKMEFEKVRNNCMGEENRIGRKESG